MYLRCVIAGSACCRTSAVIRADKPASSNTVATNFRKLYTVTSSGKPSASRTRCPSCCTLFGSRNPHVLDAMSQGLGGEFGRGLAAGASAAASGATPVTPAAADSSDPRDAVGARAEHDSDVGCSGGSQCTAAAFGARGEFVDGWRTGGACRWSDGWRRADGAVRVGSSAGGGPNRGREHAGHVCITASVGRPEWCRSGRATDRFCSGGA